MPNESFHTLLGGMRRPPGTKASGMACVTLGHLWNTPLGGHDALPSWTDHVAQHPRAEAAALANGEDGSCPTLHTPPPCVCFSGHGTGRIAPHLSVCAHGTPARVQSRTRNRPHRAAPVRLCTRCLMACAKSDTGPAEWRRTCPFAHTIECPVCTSGHNDGQGTWTPPRARAHLPTGSHGRPQLFLQTNKGRLSSRFLAGLTQRGVCRGELSPRKPNCCTNDACRARDTSSRS